ncbi:MAG: DNA polymerase III subunit chi [Ahrensia sp.]
MTQILFYHLTETALEEALPILVEKSLAKPWRVVIQTPDEAKRDALDEHLWGYRRDAFLPHGKDGDEAAHRHPIFLTTANENPNQADIRFLVDGSDVPEALEVYQRVMVMFDGKNDDAVARARTQWKALKDAGHDLAYYKQTLEGRWEKAA